MPDAAETLIERYKKKLSVLEHLVGMDNEAVADLLHELTVDFENATSGGPSQRPVKSERTGRNRANVGVRFDAMRALLSDNGPMHRRDLVNHLAGDDPKAKTSWRSAVANYMGVGKLIVTEDGYVMLPEQMVEKGQGEDADADAEGAAEDEGESEDAGEGDEEESDEGEDEDEDDDGDGADEPAFVVYSEDGTNLGHYDDLADAKRAMRRSEPGAYIKDADGVVVDTKPVARKGR